MASEEVLATVGFVVLIVVIVLVMVIRAARRFKAWTAVAERLSLTPVAENEITLPAGAEELKLLFVGHSQSTGSGAVGSSGGHDVWLFEWHSESGHGKNYSCRLMVVALLRSPELQLPHFVARPETLRRKLAEVFTGSDIDFDSAPRFSSRCQLRGEDEASIRRRFTSKVLATFEERTGLSVEGRGDLLLVCRPTGRQRPAAAVELLEHAQALAEAFKVCESGGP